MLAGPWLDAAALNIQTTYNSLQTIHCMGRTKVIEQCRIQCCLQTNRIKCEALLWKLLKFRRFVAYADYSILHCMQMILLCSTSQCCIEHARSISLWSIINRRHKIFRQQSPGSREYPDRWRFFDASRRLYVDCRLSVFMRRNCVVRTLTGSIFAIESKIRLDINAKELQTANSSMIYLQL